MGCRILVGKEGGCEDYSEEAVFFCSTSGWAFGPVAHERRDLSAYEVLDLFREWLPQDPRVYEDNELEQRWGRFIDWLDELKPTPPNKYLHADDVKERLSELPTAMEKSEKP